MSSPTIISMGSGKGGVGKTLILANLAYLCALSGKKIALVDLDISCSDLQVVFGIYRPKYSLSDFFTQKVSSLTPLMLPVSKSQNLFLIAGTGNTLSSTQLSFSQKIKLSQALSELPVDVIMLDVGAGIHADVLDFYLEADIPLVIGTPHSASIFDLSRFIKLSTVRYIARAFAQNDPVRQQLYAREYPTIKALLESTDKMDAVHRKMVIELMMCHKPQLIINKVSASSSDKHLRAFQNFTFQFSGKSEVLGLIPYGEEVEQAVNECQPLYEANPQSPVSQALAGILSKLQRLIQSHQHASKPKYSGKLRDISLTLAESFADTLASSEQKPAEGRSPISKMNLPQPLREQKEDLQLAQTPYNTNAQSTATTAAPADHSPEAPPLKKGVPSSAALSLEKKMFREEVAKIKTRLEGKMFQKPEGFRPIDIIGIMPKL
ncbi:P-loop NTPase [Deltaproteobacteria bacterium TL4]